MFLRTVYPTWQEAVRQIAIFANTHTHAPYSKTSTVSASGTLDESSHCASVSVSGLTLTMPPASERLIGQDWTVHLAVAGYVDITVSGSDTFILPEADDTIRLDTKGTSVTLRCLSSTTWGIV